jgi:hypothetical protein
MQEVQTTDNKFNLDELIDQFKEIESAASDSEGVPNEKIKHDANNLIKALEIYKSGTINIDHFLTKQPKGKDLIFPKRYIALASEAFKKMAKSKLMFNHPRVLLENIESELLDDLIEFDRTELLTRLAFYLARSNLHEYGTLTTIAMSRLHQACNFSKDIKKANLTNAEIPEVKIVTIKLAKAVLAEFLENARRQQLGVPLIEGAIATSIMEYTNEAVKNEILENNKLISSKEMVEEDLHEYA